jgi:hypothetical protein
MLFCLVAICDGGAGEQPISVLVSFAAAKQNSKRGAAPLELEGSR